MRKVAIARAGLPGRPVKLIYYDDQSNLDRSRPLYELMDVDTGERLRTNTAVPAMPIVMQRRPSSAARLAGSEHRIPLPHYFVHHAHSGPSAQQVSPRASSWRQSRIRCGAPPCLAPDGYRVAMGGAHIQAKPVQLLPRIRSASLLNKHGVAVATKCAVTADARGQQPASASEEGRMAKGDLHHANCSSERLLRLSGPRFRTPVNRR